MNPYQPCPYYANDYPEFYQNFERPQQQQSYSPLYPPYNPQANFCQPNMNHPFWRGMVPNNMGNNHPPFRNESCYNYGGSWRKMYRSSNNASFPTSVPRQTVPKGKVLPNPTGQKSSCPTKPTLGDKATVARDKQLPAKNVEDRSQQDPAKVSQDHNKQALFRTSQDNAKQASTKNIQNLKQAKELKPATIVGSQTKTEGNKDQRPVPSSIDDKDLKCSEYKRKRSTNLPPSPLRKLPRQAGDPLIESDHPTEQEANIRTDKTKDGSKNKFETTLPERVKLRRNKPPRTRIVNGMLQNSNALKKFIDTGWLNLKLKSADHQAVVHLRNKMASDSAASKVSASPERSDPPIIEATGRTRSECPKASDVVSFSCNAERSPVVISGGHTVHEVNNVASMNKDPENLHYFRNVNALEVACEVKKRIEKDAELLRNMKPQRKRADFKGYFNRKKRISLIQGVDSELLLTRVACSRAKSKKDESQNLTTVCKSPVTAVRNIFSCEKIRDRLKKQPSFLKKIQKECVVEKNIRLHSKKMAHVVETPACNNEVMCLSEDQGHIKSAKVGIPKKSQTAKLQMISSRIKNNKNSHKFVKNNVVFDSDSEEDNVTLQVIDSLPPKGNQLPPREPTKDAVVVSDKIKAKKVTKPLIMDGLSKFQSYMELHRKRDTASLSSNGSGSKCRSLSDPSPHRVEESSNLQSPRERIDDHASNIEFMPVAKSRVETCVEAIKPRNDDDCMPVTFPSIKSTCSKTSNLAKSVDANSFDSSSGSHFRPTITTSLKASNIETVNNQEKLEATRSQCDDQSVMPMTATSEVRIVGISNVTKSSFDYQHNSNMQVKHEDTTVKQTFVERLEVEKVQGNCNLQEDMAKNTRVSRDCTWNAVYSEKFHVGSHSSQETNHPNVTSVEPDAGKIDDIESVCVKNGNFWLQPDVKNLDISARVKKETIDVLDLTNDDDVASEKTVCGNSKTPNILVLLPEEQLRTKSVPDNKSRSFVESRAYAQKPSYHGIKLEKATESNSVTSDSKITLNEKIQSLLNKGKELDALENKSIDASSEKNQIYRESNLDAGKEDRPESVFKTLTKQINPKIENACPTREISNNPESPDFRGNWKIKPKSREDESTVWTEKRQVRQYSEWNELREAEAKLHGHVRKDGQTDQRRTAQKPKSSNVMNCTATEIIIDDSDDEEVFLVEDVEKSKSSAHKGVDEKVPSSLELRIENVMSLSSKEETDPFDRTVVKKDSNIPPKDTFVDHSCNDDLVNDCFNLARKISNACNVKNIITIKKMVNLLSTTLEAKEAAQLTDPVTRSSRPTNPDGPSGTFMNEGFSSCPTSCEIRPSELTYSKANCPKCRQFKPRDPPNLVNCFNTSISETVVPLRILNCVNSSNVDNATEPIGNQMIGIYPCVYDGQPPVRLYSGHYCIHHSNAEN